MITGQWRAGRRTPILFFGHPSLREGTMMEKEEQPEKLTVRELEETAPGKAAAHSA
jgi:hypothetical protein